METSYIGVIHSHGTVLRSIPRQIRLKETGEVLDLYTGQTYHKQLGTQISVVQPGDYVSDSIHITAHWLMVHAHQWETIR